MILKEELTGQLAERIPTAISAMARATKEVGLTSNGTEQELFKLMEQGKLLAKDVMPEFAKQLRQTAHDGNALGVALDTNLSVAIGKATFNLQQMSNTIFQGGLKDALKLILDSFNEIAPKTNDLAYLFGRVLGGAVTGLTAPFVLLGAVLTDTWTLMKQVTGVSDDMGKSFLSVAGTVVGMLAGLKLLIFLLKKAAQAAAGLKAVSNAVSGAAGGVDGKGKGKATGKTSKLGGLGKGLLGRAGLLGLGVSATLEHAGQGGALSASNIFGGNDFTKFLDTPISEMFSNKGNGNVANSASNPYNVNVRVSAEISPDGNILPLVRSVSRSEAEEVQDERLEQAQNSFYGGGY